MSPRKGSAIALVMGLAVVIGLLYFSMQNFVSNRSVQIHRIVDGLALGEAARQAVLEVQEQYREQRLSQSTSTYTTSVMVGEHSVQVYVEERLSRRKRWLMSENAGEHGMLDSLYFLGVACGKNDCWTAAASEIFSPEPIFSAKDYAAWDEGLPIKAVKPVRLTAWNEILPPLIIRQGLDSSCEKLESRDCRLRLFELLQSKRRKLREKEFTTAALKRNIQNGFPPLGPRVSEHYIQNLLQSMDVERNSERPELYWGIATLDHILKFTAPEGYKPPQVSIRDPQIPDFPQDLHKAFMSRWFSDQSGKHRPSRNFASLYFHDEKGVFQHYLEREELEKTVYQNPAKIHEAFLEERGMKLYGVRYVAECANPPQNGLQGFLDYVKDIQSKGGRYVHEDCSQASIEVQPILSGHKTVESPMIYLNERPWISLQSFYRLLVKLGGASEGEFPEDTSRATHSKTFGATENRQSGNLFLVPAF